MLDNQFVSLKIILYLVKNNSYIPNSLKVLCFAVDSRTLISDRGCTFDYFYKNDEENLSLLNIFSSARH